MATPAKAPKVTVKARVQDIERRILSGQTRAEIVSEYKELYNIQTVTIDRYMGIASKQIRERQNKNHTEEVAKIEGRLIELSTDAVEVLAQAMTEKYKGKPTANAINAAREVLKKTTGDRVDLRVKAEIKQVLISITEQDL